MLATPIFLRSSGGSCRFLSLFRLWLHRLPAACLLICAVSCAQTSHLISSSMTSAHGVLLPVKLLDHRHKHATLEAYLRHCLRQYLRHCLRQYLTHAVCHLPAYQEDARDGCVHVGVDITCGRACAQSNLAQSACSMSKCGMQTHDSSYSH